MVGRVLERDQFKRGIEAFAGDQALVFHERQQRLFQIVAVAGVVHVEHGEVTLVGVGFDHGIELLGRRCGPMGQFGGKRLAGERYAQSQRQHGGKQFWREIHNGVPPQG